MDCSICLLRIEDQGRTTACRHTFHRSCLNRWLEQSLTCPLCRQPIPLIDWDRIEDDDSTDAEEEDEGIGNESFDVFLYAASEMLPLFYFFQAICLSRFQNANQASLLRRIPDMFQNLMDTCSQEDFDILIGDDLGWGREEIINDFLNDDFNDTPIRSYGYDSEFDPTLGRMVDIYESIIRQNGNFTYQRFDDFLSRLSRQEEYLLFRTRRWSAVNLLRN